MDPVVSYILIMVAPIFLGILFTFLFPDNDVSGYTECVSRSGQNLGRHVWVNQKYTGNAAVHFKVCRKCGLLYKETIDIGDTEWYWYKQGFVDDPERLIEKWDAEHREYLEAEKRKAQRQYEQENRVIPWRDV